MHHSPRHPPLAAHWQSLITKTVLVVKNEETIWRSTNLTALRAVLRFFVKKIQNYQTLPKVRHCWRSSWAGERALTYCRSSQNSAERKEVSFQKNEVLPLSGHLQKTVIKKFKISKEKSVLAKQKGIAERALTSCKPSEHSDEREWVSFQTIKCEYERALTKTWHPKIQQK